MDRDDGRRENCGVVCSFRDMSTEGIRIVMDDVRNNGGSTKTGWEHSVFYTWNELNKSDVMNLKLSEKQLADIGLQIVARLVALKQSPCNNSLDTDCE